MALKDVFSFKKPYVWIGLATAGILGMAGIVNVLDQKDATTTPAQVTEEPSDDAEQIEVVVEETKEPVKTTEQIIRERFRALGREQILQQAKRVGEEGWQNGIVLLAELPEYGIAMYGYNDEEYHFQGVAVDYGSNLNFFDWKYMSSTQIVPEMFYNKADRQLQITVNLSESNQFQAEELYVLTEYDEDTLEEYAFRSADYIEEIEERLKGTGISIGSYADVRLGNRMFLKFQPVEKQGEELVTLEIHQAEILLLPSKDGFYFELGNIGLEPAERSIALQIEGKEETYTEVEYKSEKGFTLWYPKNFLEPINLYGNDGFVLPEEGMESEVKVTLVYDEALDVDVKYLKEAAGNFKGSKEYKKVTVGKVKKLTSDVKNVTIQMIEVMHDDTADRFYLVQKEEQAMMITASMPADALKTTGARVSRMIQTIEMMEAEETNEE